MLYSHVSFRCAPEKKKQYTHIFRRARPLFLPQEQLYQVHTHPRWSEPPEHYGASLDTSQAVSATHSSCRETLFISHKASQFKLLSISLNNPDSPQNKNFLGQMDYFPVGFNHSNTCLKQD